MNRDGLIARRDEAWSGRQAPQLEICDRVAWVLENMHVPDPGGYEGLAAMRMPGMDYLEILKLLHQGLKPKLYVEIGVRQGHSLFLANPETRCVAIDPEPRLAAMRPNVELSVTTSDKFFYHPDRSTTALGFDLAFIDGDHSFEQAARDFANLEQRAKPTSIIVIHDTIPMDERTATPKAQTSFHTGDVWRLGAALAHWRRDLAVVTVPCVPTGLTLVGNFRATESHIAWGIGAGGYEWGRALPFTADWDSLVHRLNISENNPAIWSAALKR